MEKKGNSKKEVNKNEVLYFSNNLCVACGKQIPEGTQVCKQCLDSFNKCEESIDDKILHQSRTDGKNAA